MNSTQPDTEKSGKLGSVACAVFFIWVGIAMLANFPWGWFLLGVGILILATQCARWLMGMKVEGFWMPARQYLLRVVYGRFSICPPSALVRQIEWVEEGRISGSS